MHAYPKRTCTCDLRNYVKHVTQQKSGTGRTRSETGSLSTYLDGEDISVCTMIRYTYTILKIIRYIVTKLCVRMYIILYVTRICHTIRAVTKCYYGNT